MQRKKELFPCAGLASHRQKTSQPDIQACSVLCKYWNDIEREVWNKKLSRKPTVSMKCLHVHWKSNKSFVNKPNTTVLQELILSFPLRPTRLVKENRHLGYRLRYRINSKQRTLVELRSLRARPASQNTQR